jgi:predicted TIM-barrel fold metal-dependent hydrolase
MWLAGAPEAFDEGVLCMRVEDMTLVSIDDHIIEPADLFEEFMPEAYKDLAPKVKYFADGTNRWIFQDTEIGTGGLQAVASWPHDEWDNEPVGFADMRPGCYGVDERILDMNANGVLSSMCFPTFVGFAGSHLSKVPDLALSTMVVSAYNDWHLDGWAAKYPGRFMPLGILPLWDPEAAAKEVRRLAQRGFTAVSLPDTPYATSHNTLPSYYTDYWDPIFQAMQDEDIAGCLHIGGSFNLLERPEEAPLDQRIILAAQFSAVATVDLVVGGVFEKFPDLKIAMSEGGIGWIPLLLDRVDFHLTNQTWSDWDLKGRSATDIWRKNFLGCFIREPSGLKQWDRIGIDTIAWECDYPHSDSSWPQSADLLHGEITGAELTDEQIDKITWQNACRFFRYDVHEKAGISRAGGTVGALRALATDVDVSTTSRYEYRRRYQELHPVSA